MATLHTKPLTLAFSGGGAKCAAQAGVLDVLEGVGLYVDGLTGASAGALVAVLYGLGFSPLAIRDYIADTNLLEVWELDPKRRGLFGLEKIRARLKGAVGDKTFADLRIPVVVIATDYYSGREIRIREGRLDEALIATMAIPGLFVPLEREGLTLVDGGASNPMPVDVARALGPRVIAVDVLHHQADSNTHLQLFETRGPIRYATEIATRLGFIDLMEAVHQTATIMSRHMSELSLQANPPDILLRPETGHVGLFAFDLASEAFERGHVAAREQLEEIEWLARPRSHSLAAWRALWRSEQQHVKAKKKFLDVNSN